MIGNGSARLAMAALSLIVATTISWWALALWPVGLEAPQWFLRTRAVCFGASGNALPDAGGWVLLIGQPIGMLGLLLAAWGAELRTAVSQAMTRAGGQVMVGALLALLASGVVGVAARMRDSRQEPFDAGGIDIAGQLTRVNDAAPGLALVDQTGREVTLASFRGRPVLVAFAYAHCQTVCPLVVSDVLAARNRFERDPPVVLLVTLDPWRDTPSRLDSIAKQWGVSGEAHVLSGAPDVVERTLSNWRVPSTRNPRTGDISHPSIVYVIGPDGRISYVLSGNPDAIAAAIRAL